MPLFKGKSKKAFGKNVATEMEAGKPQDQALAIAYGVQKKQKKMSMGGKAEADGSVPLPPRKPDNMRLPEEQYMGDKMSVGGMIDEVISRRKARKMAEGGQVALDKNEETPSVFEDRDEAIMKENYDEDFMSMSQPEDSNEHGDSLKDEDKLDMVSALRKRMKAKKS